MREDLVTVRMPQQVGMRSAGGIGGRVTTETTERDAGIGLDHVRDVATRLMAAMTSVIEGKDGAVRTTITVLFAGGHLLIEDVPGVGKTMLAKTLARSIDAAVRRIQFTPDLLPSDVTGVSVFNQDARTFEFRPGAIFANVVVGDEINRASPKTQSALLESMEERQVTVDGTTYRLREPFIVMATQNPIEMEGTYPLPEAQRDRFMARISMGYPSPRAGRDRPSPRSPSPAAVARRSARHARRRSSFPPRRSDRP
jgi:MoxR-like ATPase